MDDTKTALEPQWLRFPAREPLHDVAHGLAYPTSASVSMTCVRPAAPARVDRRKPTGAKDVLAPQRLWLPAWAWLHDVAHGLGYPTSPMSSRPLPASPLERTTTGVILCGRPAGARNIPQFGRNTFLQLKLVGPS